MKTSINTAAMKQTAQDTGVSAVKTVTAPVHFVLQFGTNLAYVIGNKLTDGVAAAEGYFVEKINGTPREQTAGLRTEYTQMKMLEMAAKADEVRKRLGRGVKQAEVAINDAKQKVASQFKKQEDQLAVNDMVTEFSLQTLRRNRQLLVDDESMDQPTKNKIMNAINQAIGKLKKGIEPATVQQAFELTIQPAVQ